MTAAPSILVVGASGFLGRTVVSLLTQRGVPVRALVRTGSVAPEQLVHRSVVTCVGDLKDPASLEQACLGVRCVVSTATSTRSMGPLDSVETVDGRGQLALVAAAEAAGVQDFVFVSFPRGDVDSTLQQAKRNVEAALARSPMRSVVLHAANFMEVWLSAAVGFDPRSSVRLFGDGTQPVSWVSLLDVARCAVMAAMGETRAGVLPIAAPGPLSPREIVDLLATYGASPRIETVPEAFLEQQLVSAEPLERAFAAIALNTARGQVTDHTVLAELLGDSHTKLEAYLRTLVKN